MSAAPVPRPRRFDPNRRERLLDACLDVIAEEGVAGLSHRKVAAAADVPLGSTTYHFDGLDHMVFEAFERFSEASSDRFEIAMTGAGDLADAREAVVELITGGSITAQRELVLMTELYALAAREPRYRSITHAWMQRSRAALARHFDPTTVAMLDALIEGLTLHRALDDGTGEDADAAEAVRRITLG